MDTRQAILNTALDLFSEIGYENCGVQRICELSGLTKPTLYHHFGNKRGVLDALVAGMAKPLLEAVERNRYSHDLPFTLMNLTRDYLGVASSRPMEFRYFISLQLAPPETESHLAVRAADHRITEAITRLFALASEDHGNMRNRQQLLAASYRGMVNMYGILVAQRRMELNESFLTEAVRIFSYGIYS